LGEKIKRKKDGGKAMKKIISMVATMFFVGLFVAGGAFAGCGNGMLLPLTANVSSKTVESGETTVIITGVKVTKFEHYAHDGVKDISSNGEGIYKFNAYHGLGFNFTFVSKECSNNDPFVLLTPGMVSEARATGKPVYFLKDGTVAIDCNRPDGSCAMVVRN